MNTRIISSALVIMLIGGFARAQEKAKIPAGAEGVEKALKESPRHGEWVEVPVGDAKVRTWVVYPERKEKAPVVIVIHEIFGLTDWVRGVADQLAADGFIAVAPDLLSGKGPNGGGTDSFGDKAREAVGKLTEDEVNARLDAVREFALKFPSAGEKTATIGFCWGGKASFAYAAHQPKLNGAIVYYGAPPAKEAMAKIACPVLGCYGQNDARITATVEATTASMKELNKPYAPNVYDGAGHGFLRQQSGSEANQKAAEKAWGETAAFLKKNLE